MVEIGAEQQNLGLSGFKQPTMGVLTGQTWNITQKVGLTAKTWWGLASQACISVWKWVARKEVGDFVSKNEGNPSDLGVTFPCICAGIPISDFAYIIFGLSLNRGTPKSDGPSVHYHFPMWLWDNGYEMGSIPLLNPYLQCEAPKIAKLVQITPISLWFMVLITN